MYVRPGNIREEWVRLKWRREGREMRAWNTWDAWCIIRASASSNNNYNASIHLAACNSETIRPVAKQLAD